MKKKILISAILAAMLAGNTAFANIQITSGMLDRAFTTSRTQYYVDMTSDTIPVIEIPGYEVVATAKKPFTGGALTMDNITVLKDGVTNVNYRFVISKKGGTVTIADEDGLAITPQGVLTIKGTVEGMDKVTVFILRPKAAYSETSYEWKDVNLSAMENTVLDVKEVLAKDIKDGVILTYNFPANTVSGQYGVFITGEGIAQSAHDTKYYSSQTEINEHISQVNSKSQFSDTKPVSELRSYVETNSKGLQLDMTHYNKLGSEQNKGRDVAISLMESTGNYADLDEIAQAFYKGVVVGTANEGKSLNDVLAAYNQYLNLELYDKYKTLKDDSAVEASLKGVTTIANMRTIFNRQTVISMINEADLEGIQSIMNTYISYLDLASDIKSKYENNVEACVPALGNKNFSNTGEIEKAIGEVKISNGSNVQGTVTTSKPSNNAGYVATGNLEKTDETENQPGTDQAPETNISALPFNDIAHVSWAHTAIKYLYDNKILNGKSAGVFAPDDYIKREEFVKLVVNSFALDSTKDVTFKDVQKGAWYESFIKTAYASGVVKGISSELFGVGRFITREEMAAMIYRAVEASGMNTEIIIENPAQLTDLDTVSPYAREAVEFMIEKGAVNGINGKFIPKSYATRAQTAKILYQIIKIR